MVMLAMVATDVEIILVVVGHLNAVPWDDYKSDIHQVSLSHILCLFNFL